MPLRADIIAQTVKNAVIRLFFVKAVANIASNVLMNFAKAVICAPSVL